MMTKRKNHLLLSVMYVTAIPVAAMLLVAFANRAIKPIAPDTYSASVRLVLPEETKPSISPVNLKKVTGLNPFGDARNWASNMLEFHSGIDFEMEEGSEIVATADGVVVEVRTDPYRGNYILIKHDGIYSTHYSHMKDWAVEEGVRVTKGQIIGYVGATGSVLSPHLHYEVRKMGQAVNPKDFLPKLDGC
jgi:bla regulator protein BlaR1